MAAKQPPSPTASPVLGLEAGGTRTVALAVDAADRVLARVEAGPANLRLLDEAALRRHFAALAAQLPVPAAVGIGMAGAREESDRRRIRAAAARAWPGVPCWAGNDLDTAFAAAGPLGPEVAARVVVLSGTGSCCFGRHRAGRSAKVGGWGHLLGDRGSGYDVALSALRAVVESLDRTGRWPRLGARLLRALALNEPNELVTWLHAAGKADVAALAVEVGAAAAAGDRLAAGVLRAAADALARQAIECANRLARAGEVVEFVFTGGLLQQQARFAARVRQQVSAARPGARFWRLEREGAWGAVALARAYLTESAPAAPGVAASVPAMKAGENGAPVAWPIPEATAPSPTEGRNPRSRRLDRMSVRAAIELMLREEARLPSAVRAVRAGLERAVRLAVASLRRGGRLIYVGAGTSGRLGVLDASECPPTFGVEPERVQGIVAGGATALWQSIEGAEDDAAAGARAVQFRGVGPRDVVVGLAASGRTPFVWGALHAARAAGARTVLVCFNPHLRFARGTRPDLVLAPVVGPEVLTGSTRLKAGTATKMMLNILSTLTMVRLGKVVENLMVDVRPTNAKLRDRAVRIVQTLTRAEAAVARAALERTGWRVKAAVRRLWQRARRA